MSRRTSIKALLKVGTDRRTPASLLHHFRELAWRAYYRRQKRDDEIKATRKNTRGLLLGTCRFSPDDARHRRVVRLKKYARRADRRFQEREAVRIIQERNAQVLGNPSSGKGRKGFLRRVAEVLRLPRLSRA